MKKRIEKYFEAALQSIRVVLQENNEQAVIDREYQGYISAFGASVMQMGLLPTLAVHADEGSDSAKDRRKLLRVLAETLVRENNVISARLRSALTGKEDQLFKVAVANQALLPELQEHLLDAAVAVKLCIRTFKLSEA